MIRRINDYNGFSDRNENNINYITYNTFPKQNTDYVGKWLTISFKRESENLLNTRFHIPGGVYTNYTYLPNSGDQMFFRILRFDSDSPNRCILCNLRNEIIVTTTSEILKLYDLNGSIIYEGVQLRAKGAGYDYAPNNITKDPAVFFESYNNEKIHTYHIQDDNLLGKIVYTEYYQDILNEDKSFNTLETVNDFTFTAERREFVLSLFPNLGMYPDRWLNNYPTTYNIHEQAKNVNKAYRAHNVGVIVRADYSYDDDSCVVVLEYVDDNKIRFICDDEARLYYDTDSEIAEDYNVMNILNNYSVFIE